ncbi:MAG TPA: acetyl-CoA carboxylase biotin carboxyl carrier protein subunit [Bacteroidales bacterium]|nr:acetyl-CoA carboxylase biotin carboxyl carrier protein subunit [Bacteroidales bacterium]HPJ59798.1 acetyl-CoA carboxylase biotin carboxyl carrier protein subunit [Bacteroidales bacterium]HPR13026.1 acetyl-CoA carboxylase biotin carboxyl carrier protein subunit [Bacteroidales bacterium]
MAKKKEFGTLNINSTLYTTRISSRFEERVPFKKQDPFNVLSFIPGTVLDILVTPGQEVHKGDALIILDAMKMQNSLKSSVDAKVKEILVKTGDRVPKGAALIILE